MYVVSSFQDYLLDRGRMISSLVEATGMFVRIIYSRSWLSLSRVIMQVLASCFEDFQRRIHTVLFLVRWSGLVELALSLIHRALKNSIIWCVFDLWISQLHSLNWSMKHFEKPILQFRMHDFVSLCNSQKTVLLKLAHCLLSMAIQHHFCCILQLI